jgi:xylitol oxidase
MLDIELHSRSADTAEEALMSNTNWAGNLTYSTERLHAPQSLGELQDIVRQAKRAHAVGSRHSFTPIADTDSEQISLRHMNRLLSIDKVGQTVTVEGGITYGQLGPALHQAGFALQNLASLSTITIAGAVATGTHGSGSANKNLSTAVCGVKIVTGDGEIVAFNRGDADFDGVVVSLGALGVVAELTLDIQPGFAVRQEVYTDLPFETLAANFDDIMGSAYSVSPFHAWAGDTIGRVFVKKLATAPRLAGDFFGAKAALQPSNPLPLVDPEPVTEQMGVPGPAYLRLPHFRDEAIAPAGAEIQAEYFVSRHRAGEALRAVQAVQHHLEKVLMIGEIRTIAADSLWLSPAFERDSLAFHFTCYRDWPALKAALPAIEAALRPFEPRPHWAKVFTMTAPEVQRSYPRLPQFRALRKQLDPQGKFGNAFIDEFIG